MTAADQPMQDGFKVSIKPVALTSNLKLSDKPSQMAEICSVNIK